MPKTRRPTAKEIALQQEGVLNPHPERVHDPQFTDNDFFDSHDLVQVKYELLRRVEVEGQPLTATAAAFGLSRPSVYKAQAAFAREGLPGLLPQRRGPRRAHKLSAEVMAYVEEERQSDPALRAPALAARIYQQFGIQVHPRSIERALARQQKKRR